MESSFLVDKGIDAVLALAGAMFGFYLGAREDKRSRTQQEKIRRQALLEELIKSLEQNLKYLNQMEELASSRGEWPTFHLDTIWLHYFASTVCIEMPSTSKYRDKFNQLRFDLDRINQTIDIVFMLHPSSEAGARAEATMHVIRTIIPQFKKAKEQLRLVIEELSPLVA